MAVPAGAAAGQARRYQDGRFATANGRALFHATPYRPPADAVNAHYPSACSPAGCATNGTA